MKERAFDERNDSFMIQIERTRYDGDAIEAAWAAQGVNASLLSDASTWKAQFPQKAGERSAATAPFIYEGRDVIEGALAALLSGEHLLLVGPKATGKNVLAANLAAVFGRPVWNVSFHVQMDAEGLLGTDTLAKGAVVFRPGPVVACAEAGGFAVLDEINMARNEALAVLHSLLDDRRMVEVPGHGIVELSPAARVIGTMNHGYAGTRELNEALASRFVVLRMPELSEAALRKLLAKGCPALSENGRRRLGKLFLALAEKHAQGEISSRAVDLRGMFAAVRMMQRGVRPWQAVAMGMVDKCMEEEERAIASDVVRLFLAEDDTAAAFFQ